MAHTACAWTENDVMDLEIIKEQIEVFICEFNPSDDRRDHRDRKWDRQQVKNKEKQVFASGDKTKPHCSVCAILFGKIYIMLPSMLPSPSITGIGLAKGT
jgi:hypothetical protein